jgi:hypothetical protein
VIPLDRGPDELAHVFLLAGFELCSSEEWKLQRNGSFRGMEALFQTTRYIDE